MKELIKPEPKNLIFKDVSAFCEECDGSKYSWYQQYSYTTCYVTDAEKSGEDDEILF